MVILPSLQKNNIPLQALHSTKKLVLHQQTFFGKKLFSSIRKHVYIKRRFGWKRNAQFARKNIPRLMLSQSFVVMHALKKQVNVENDFNLSLR